MKPRQLIIVYPDNTFCVDGKMKQHDDKYLAELGVEPVRAHDKRYNTPDARIIAFGQALRVGGVAAGTKFNKQFLTPEPL